MRLLSAIFLLLVCNCATAQTDSYVIYDWEDLPANVNADTIYGLSFSKMRMDIVPSSLSKFNNLIYLDLSKNKLDDLPTFIGDMVHLKDLNIEKNKFEVMPIEICKLKNIERLNLSRNFIGVVLSCFEYLTALKYIDLYGNPIRNLPESFERMQNLEEMNLGGIRFSPIFQESWKARLPNVKFVFDPPCDCMK